MFNNEDLVFTTTLADHQNVSTRIQQEPQGFYVLHKPSGVDVKITHHKTVHKNKTEAMIILKDLLTKEDLDYGDKGYFISEDEVFNRTIGIQVINSWDMVHVRDENSPQDFVCRTPECAKYLARKNI